MPAPFPVTQLLVKLLLKEEMMGNDPKKLDLKPTANDVAHADRIVARLEGKLDDVAVKLWGEEFAASGGGKPPPPQPSV